MRPARPQRRYHRCMESGDLETRVIALEHQVRELGVRLRANEQDAAAARVLAGAADRDVGEIRAELRDFRQASVGSINSLRADFVDLRENVVDLRGEIIEKFGMAAVGQQQIITLIEMLIDREAGGNR